LRASQVYRKGKSLDEVKATIDREFGM